MKGTNYSQAFYELIFTTHFGLLGDLVIALLAPPRQLYTVGKIRQKIASVASNYKIIPKKEIFKLGFFCDSLRSKNF